MNVSSTGLLLFRGWFKDDALSYCVVNQLLRGLMKVYLEASCPLGIVAVGRNAAYNALCALMRSEVINGIDRLQ